MNRVLSLHELRPELEQLEHRREQLAAQLMDAANRLDTPGEPLPDELIDELEAYCTRTLQLAEQLGVAGDLSDDAVAASITLRELSLLLGDRERRERVMPVLDAVLKLRYVEAADFEPLLSCQSEARRLMELGRQPGGMQANSDLEAIGGQTHPFNHLLKLCEQGGGLSDSDWIECNDRVTAAFGRQLATALARGRIQRVADGVTATAEPAPAVAPRNPSPGAMCLPSALPIMIEAAVESRPVTPPRSGLGADSIFEPSPLADSVFNEPTPRQKLPALTWLAADQRPGEPPSTASPLSAMADNRPVRVSPNVADTDSRMSSPQRCQVVVQLVSEDRLPLAMHLARCAEFRPGLPVPYPPTWLLRSLILGMHLSDPKGELARQLDDDLSNFRPEVLTDGDADRQVAAGFLLRAAALPAALLSGSTPAIAVLRAVKIASGCSQLYNYCSRLALYGDRLDGQIVEMFRPPLDEIEDLDPQSLAESASRWLEETARKPVAYSRTSLLFLHAHWTLTSSTSIQHSDATQVWCKWQETLQLASRLLRPVCRNLDGERHWVRQEIARLSASMRAETSGNSSRNAVPVRNSLSNAAPMDEMHAVLRQAIELANRWLRLSGATSSGLAGQLSQDALDLRDEVMARTAGVLSELNEQSQVHSSPLVLAGIECCRRSVARIHALFAGNRSLPLKETDPRHALHAELLKIPGLELNDQWLPETDPATLERELIEYLNRGDTSWRQAYEQHARHGDHVATGRLLELNVWSNEAEREALQADRNAQIAEHRQSLAKELSEAARDLEVIGRSGQLLEADGEVFAQRLERLRREMPGLLNFGSCRWQLDQIRSALQRRRIRPVSEGGLVQPDWSAANLERRRVPVAAATVIARADMAFTHETVTMVTDIFSEE